MEEFSISSRTGWRMWGLMDVGFLVHVCSMIYVCADFCKNQGYESPKLFPAWSALYMWAVTYLSSNTKCYGRGFNIISDWMAHVRSDACGFSSPCVFVVLCTDFRRNEEIRVSLMFWPPWFALYICEMWQKMTDPVPDRVLHVRRAHYCHLSTQFCRDSYSSFTSYLHWMPWYPKHQESLQRQLACRIPHRNGAGNYGDLEPRGQAFDSGVSGMQETVKVCAQLLVSVDRSAIISLVSSHSTDT